MDEDVYVSRPQDVIIPSRENARKVAMKLLELYDFRAPERRLEAFNGGFIVANSKFMHKCDWTLIAELMDVYDQKKVKS
jgi:hypothetical protein